MQLSVYRGTGGIQALMNSNARKQAEQDESIVMASGIPYTIIRAGLLQNTPGGQQGFSFNEVLFIFIHIFLILYTCKNLQISVTIRLIYCITIS